jgi:hypothetical protein
MGQVIQVNGDYTIKARRPGGAHITFDTGPQVGTVTVTGNLQVLGTTQTFNSQAISDVVLLLNRGETGAGVTIGKSGLEVDRGTLDRADFLFDESLNAWTISHRDVSTSLYSYDDSNLVVKNILTNTSTDNGDLTLISTGTGIVKVAGTTNYETRVIDYTRLTSVQITHIARSSSGNTITVTTSGNHGLSINDVIDIHCATFPALNVSNKSIVDVPTLTTLKYAATGSDIVTTPVSGYLIKNSLVWPVNGSNIPTDDYIPNMRAVSDYSRSLVNAAITRFSSSHIEDQNSNITVYDSETLGDHSKITFTVDSLERVRIDHDGHVGIGTTTPAYPLDVIATEIRIQSGTDTVKEYIGPQTNGGYLFGSSTEIGLKSDTTSASVIFSKDTNTEYLRLKAGSGTSVLEMFTADTKRATIDATGKMFINTTVGSSQLNISSLNEYPGTGYAGLITLKNTVSGSTLSQKHIKISSVGDFELANNDNTSSILKITDTGVTTLINGLNVIDYIRTTSTSFDLINANATTVNFAGAGLTINVGSNASGTTTNLKNATVAIGNTNSAAYITTPATTFNLVNDVAETVNFAGDGTAVNIGKTTGAGTTILYNDVTRVGTRTTASITTPATTFDLINTDVSTLNFAGAGTDIIIGATTGKTTIRNPELIVGTSGAATSKIRSPSATVELLNVDTTTVKFAGAAGTIDIGSAAQSTVTNLKNSDVKVGNGAISAITTPSTTFDLLNSTATTVNFAGAATTISMGSPLPGTTTINHNLVVIGTLTFNGGATEISSTVLQVQDPLIYLGDNNANDTVCLGFYAAYDYVAPPGTHPHTGLVRNPANKEWNLFSNAPEPASNMFDFANVTYDALRMGDLAAVKGTFSGDLSAVKGTFSGDLKVGSNFTVATSSGNITTTGNLSAKDGIFTGNITATGNISGETITGTSFAGINISMVTDGCSVAAAAALAAAAATGVTDGLSGGSISVPPPNLTGPITSIGVATSINPANKTGSSNIFVVDDTPTLKTPVLGVATATSINKVEITEPATKATLTLADNSKLITDGGFDLTLKITAATTATFPEGTTVKVGYLDLPQVIQNSQGGPGLDAVGKHWFHADAAPVTYYIDGNEPFPIGSVLTFINDYGAGDITLTVTSATLSLAGTGDVSSLSVTIAADGIATAIKTTATRWLINGAGITPV